MIHLCGANVELPADCALTVGKFESLHKGHRKLIQETLRLAAPNGLLSAVVTFNPHPRALLAEPSYQPLFTSAERAHILRGLGVDYLVEYAFDAAFALLSPDAFCKLLFEKLRSRVLVVGECYCFGRNRAGTVDTLIEAARPYNAAVTVVPHQSEDGRKISTSDIRAMIAAHHLQEAAKCLGFSFLVMGRVEHGRQIGRTWGFPTVNIRPASDKWLPPNGVYISRTRYGDTVYKSVTNIGVKPTMTHSAGGTEAVRIVESFLLNFSGDLYGKEIVTELISFLRPEKNFGYVAALQEQIQRDITAAENYFSTEAQGHPRVRA